MTDSERRAAWTDGYERRDMQTQVEQTGGKDLDYYRARREGERALEREASGAYLYGTGGYFYSESA